MKYEKMLELVEKDIKNYQERLNQAYVNKKPGDNDVIIKQISTVLKEIKSLECYLKCSQGKLNNIF